MVLLSHSTYCCASSQLTSRTGEFFALSAMVGTRWQPPASTQAFHCSTVTSKRPIANGWPMVTWCGGFSAGSLALLPMVKLPAGSVTSTGHAGQSRISPGRVGGGATLTAPPAAAPPLGAAAEGGAGAGAGAERAAAGADAAGARETCPPEEVPDRGGGAGCCCAFGAGAGADARSRSSRALASTAKRPLGYCFR
ncbi:hypothetical protein D9M70_497120 [compost metagenome]